MDFLADFGVQPVLLAAQVVNFLILLIILKKFLYKPILKILDERKKRIEESLKNAEEIEKRLIEMAEKEAESLRRSAREGEKIIREASDYAVQLKEDGKNEYEKLLRRGILDVKEMKMAEKENIMREVREDMAGIVVVALEKIIGKSSREEQKKIIEKEFKNMS